MKTICRLSFLCSIFVWSCGSPGAGSTEEEVETHTPVTVTNPIFGPVKETVMLNATAVFRQQNFVKANLTGYVKKVYAVKGYPVHAGQTLFVLKTKEAEAIGNAVNKLNSSFNFSGVNVIKAGAAGFISDVNHQAGDYVQDGEQLAVISDAGSFSFIMNVPYEDQTFVLPGKEVIVILPDGERRQAKVSALLPTMDSVSQTRSVALSLANKNGIPENLVAQVEIVKSAKTVSLLLPKKTVLSDESLTAFWIMKMINDTTAVKVPVKTGIETGDNIEILKPALSAEDRILLSGNYGLADTAFVILQK